MKKELIFISIAVFILSGCSQHFGPKEGAGTLLGATAGAIAGSNIGKGKGNIAAIAIGTVAGALFGQELGRSLDRADRITMAQNTQNSLEYSLSDTTTNWTNPDSGNSGSMTPLRTYQTGSGQYCREYQQTVVIGGNVQEAYGTACRQPDGSWKIVSTRQNAELSRRYAAVQQPERHHLSSAAYRSTPPYVWFYPSYMALSFSFSDHNHRHSYFHSRKHRGYSHGHSHRYGSKKWKARKGHKWSKNRW